MISEARERTDAEQAIEAWIEMLSRSGSAMAPLLRDHGRWWQAAPLPEGEARGEERQCFSNSQQRILANWMGDGDLTYVEGIACSGRLSFSFPVHHGWLVDPDGVVVDLTWERPERATYFGVPFNDMYVMAQARETGMWCALLDHPYNGFALLKGLHPVATAFLDWDNRDA